MGQKYICYGKDSWPVPDKPNWDEVVESLAFFCPEITCLYFLGHYRAIKKGMRILPHDLSDDYENRCKGCKGSDSDMCPRNWD